MIPHTLVLERGRRLYKIYNGYWFFGRPTVEELRLDLRAVLQRSRPDWDIGSEAQRAAWASGDKAGFYPYGKSQAQLYERAILIVRPEAYMKVYVVSLGVGVLVACSRGL